MPVYDYKCSTHGIYSELATIEDAAKPTPCPQCGEFSARVICLPSQLFKLDEGQRAAYATNEKAQHEPVVSTKERRELDDLHQQGCGCNKQKPSKSSLIYTANGEKMFPSARPWMISH